MPAKIHPWPTRRHPETGRYEVLIAERWVSRQRAWAILQRMDGRCPQCGVESISSHCPKCARKKALGKGYRWIGPWKQGRRGRPPKQVEAYSKLLPTVKIES